MEKTFKGWLFNRIETLGNRKYNHIGCEGESEEFINFLSEFVPELGMRRKVKFTIEALEEPQILEVYKDGEYDEKNNN
ncbi:MAG: hypothetical protein ACTSSP_11410 [Candidatus Asgardarchaeia archaeon]